MDSLLDALQEGRLIELPDNDKFHALQFLAHIIEAIPSVPNGTDVAGFVLNREKSAVTALGRGFACPHARVSYDDDLICSVGWSPQGIDYCASDNSPIHIVIMYLVPDNQRNHYLKEVSILAKALMNSNAGALSKANDLDAVRNYLLDLVSSTKSIAGTETRARMIQLETRGIGQLQEIQNLSNLIIEPVTVVSENNMKHIILSQNKEIVDVLDSSSALVETINNKGIFEKNGWRIIKKSSIDFQLNRSILECIAVKVNSNNNNNNSGSKKPV